MKKFKKKKAKDKKIEKNEKKINNNNINLNQEKIKLKLIISTIGNSKDQCYKIMIEERKWCSMKVIPLNKLERENLANDYLSLFGKKFDFNLINILHNLIENPDPTTCNKSLHEVITYLENNQTLLEEKIGKEELQNLLLSFKELEQKLDEELYFRRLILQDSLPKLKKIGGIVLYKNLDSLQKENLELNSSEIKAIKTKVIDKYKDNPISEQKKTLENELDNALTLRWRHFARTVNPWFVKEANQKVVTILDELQKNHLNESEEALHEGFELMRNMEIQHKKRLLVHILGMLALTIGAITLTTALCGCPITAIVLSVLIVGFGISRMVVCKGTLDVKGWSFLFDNLFPDFLKKRLFKALPEEELSAFYRKKKIISITPVASSSSPIHLTRLYA